MKLVLLFLSVFFTLQSNCQAIKEAKSTQDLSFLTGHWNIERTYNPGTDEPRILKGSLECKRALHDQFIECLYKMERSDKSVVLDKVYFNYNSVYNTYESLWLSSTWPVKVLMHGNLESKNDSIKLGTRAEFKIENDVTEYVYDELIFNSGSAKTKSFQRNTLVKTDKDKIWKHHTTEIAVKIDTAKSINGKD